MTTDLPSKVLITGGHEVGGVASFAEGLSQGFRELGVPVEVIDPGSILGHWHELRDHKVLKILSTTAVFAAPVARRAICIAHGIPRVYGRGWPRFIAILLSFKMANWSRGARLISVSAYAAEHLRTIFNMTVDGVVLNPIKNIYLEPLNGIPATRPYITYVGRIDKVKNLHRLLPSVCDLLEKLPGMSLSIVGDGEDRADLERAYSSNPRINFEGCPDDRWVRNRLRETKLFISGHTTEGLGIAFIEALSQGCSVAMPASGGGIEIALGEIGGAVHLLPIDFERNAVLGVLRRAVESENHPMRADQFSARSVAASYLRADRGGNGEGCTDVLPIFEKRRT